MSVDGDTEPQRPKRPAMQIYRPPGMRSGVDPAAGGCSPNQVKHAPQQPPNQGKAIEADRASNASSDSRTSSSAKSDKPKSRSRPREAAKKQFGQKEFADIAAGLRRLSLANEAGLVDEFVNGRMESEESGFVLGALLARHAIEEASKQSQKAVARLCAALIECPAGPAFQRGLLSSLAQYYECREDLRATHSKLWTAFLNFMSDVYAQAGLEHQLDELVELLFKVFEFMFDKATLTTLRIEELESVISSMLSVGYNLERDCPDHLGLLKDRIRDAFVQAHEPWARKMIMLLMELSASGWSLSADANEYYFQ